MEKGIILYISFYFFFFGTFFIESCEYIQRMAN